MNFYKPPTRLFINTIIIGCLFLLFYYSRWYFLSAHSFYWFPVGDEIPPLGAINLLFIIGAISFNDNIVFIISVFVLEYLLLCLLIAGTVELLIWLKSKSKKNAEN